MAIKFLELHEEHANLVYNIRSNSNLSPKPFVKEASILLEKIRLAGRSESDTSRRQRLEAYAAYWGAFIFDNSGIYPDTKLKAFDIISSEVSVGEKDHQRPVPFQAPPLPHHFVTRSEINTELKTYLLTDEASSDASDISAVHGLGGVGKSTLVASLANDQDIWKRFPDGVLWVTLSQQPDLTLLLNNWLQTLGDYSFRAIETETISNHLRNILQNKSILLIVDDAWQADHAIPFLVGGPHCHTLITTRDAEVAEDVGARIYNLDVMTEAQSLSLFEKQLGQLDNNDHGQAVALAKELGYLPLALELAAAKLKADSSWSALLNIFRKRVANLTKFAAKDVTYRNESLRLSLGLSLEALSDDDRSAFMWLGVLPEDIVINPTIATRLWGQLEDPDADKRLHRFQERALLRSVSDDHPYYILHDLLHEEAKIQLADHIMPLPQAHATLLERYKRDTQNNLWHTLDNDGYIYAHLTWHMEQADQIAEIHNLLREENSEGRSGWYQAKDDLKQTEGFLEDVERVWHLAKKEFSIDLSPISFALQWRYALIIVSLNSLAKSIPPKLMVASIEKNLWTPDQGLTYIRQVPDLRQRAKALAILSPALPPKNLSQALAIARDIDGEQYTAEALAGIACYFPEPIQGQLLEEALNIAQAINNADRQAEALLELVHQSTSTLLPEIMTVVRKIEKSDARSKVLMHIAPHLAELNRFETALAIMQEIDGSFYIDGFKKLAPYLVTTMLPEVLTIVQSLDQEIDQLEMRVGLAPCSTETVLQETFAAVLEIKDNTIQLQMLVDLAPFLPEAQEEALRIARVIEDEWARCDALARLAPYISEALLPHTIMETVDTIKDNIARANALAGLAPRLAELGQFDEALAIIQNIKDEYQKSDILVKLAPRLPEVGLERLLATVQAIEDEYWRTKAIEGVAPYLPKKLLEDALVMVQVTDDETDRIVTLTNLANHLSQEYREVFLQDILVAVRKIQDSDTRSELLVGLYPLLSKARRAEVLQEAFKASNAIKKSQFRLEMLVKLIPDSPSPLREKALFGALLLVQNIENAQIQTEWLTVLVPFLPESLQRKAVKGALKSAQTIKDDQSRIETLVKLASNLSESLIEETLVTVKKIWEIGEEREESLSKVLVAVQAIADEQKEVQLLARLFPQLTKPVEKTLKKAARKISPDKQKAQALATLATFLSKDNQEELVEEALAILRRIVNKYHRAIAHLDLIPYLPTQSKEDFLQDVRAISQKIDDEYSKAMILLKQVPYLTEPFRDKALQEIWESSQKIEDSLERTNILVRLTSYVSGTLQIDVLRQALSSVGAIDDMTSRVEALSVLVSNCLTLPRSDLTELWLNNDKETSFLQVLARRTRQNFLVDICALTPIIAVLGGEEAIKQIIFAIQDVGQWFPSGFHERLTKGNDKASKHSEQDIAPATWAKVETLLDSFVQSEQGEIMLTEVIQEEKYQTDHLILLIGSNPLPNYVAAQMLCPNGKLYLLHSTDTIIFAQKLRSKFGVERCTLKTLGAFESEPHQIYQAMKEILKAIPGQDNVGLHYTGGTKVMSVHAYRALLKAQRKAVFSYLDARSLEIVISGTDDEQDTRVYVGDSIQIAVEDLLDLHNIKLKSSPKREARLVEVTQALVEIHQEKSNRQAWREWCDTQLKRADIAKEWVVTGATEQIGTHSWQEVTQEASKFKSTGQLKSAVLPDIENLVKIRRAFATYLPELAQFDLVTLLEVSNFPGKVTHLARWLDGEWLEDYMLWSLQQLAQVDGYNFNAPGMDYVAQDPQFQFDVAMTKGYQLFAFSCTTSDEKYICKGKLFEAYIRAQQMGGEEAKTVLACCYEDVDRLQDEMSREFNATGRIKVFGPEDLPNLKNSLKQWLDALELK